MYEMISLKEVGEKVADLSNLGNESSLLRENQKELYISTELQLIKFLPMRVQVNNLNTTIPVYWN